MPHSRPRAPAGGGRLACRSGGVQRYAALGNQGEGPQGGPPLLYTRCHCSQCSLRGKGRRSAAELYQRCLKDAGTASHSQKKKRDGLTWSLASHTVMLPASFPCGLAVADPDTHSPGIHALEVSWALPVSTRRRRLPIPLAEGIDLLADVPLFGCLGLARWQALPLSFTIRKHSAPRMTPVSCCICTRMRNIQ